MTRVLVRFCNSIITRANKNNFDENLSNDMPSNSPPSDDFLFTVFTVVHHSGAGSKFNLFFFK